MLSFALHKDLVLDRAPPAEHAYPAHCQEFSDCVKASNKDTFRAACKEFRDDYMECLHHNKEVCRITTPKCFHRPSSAVCASPSSGAVWICRCFPLTALILLRLDSLFVRSAREAMPRGFMHKALCADWPLPPCAQILRLNAMDAELSRKKAAGESIPTLLAEDVARGEMKLPYTNIGK